MSDSARRQLLVEVGRCLFAADADEVREVIDPTEATPIPGAAAGVLGLLNRRGKVIVAGELGTFLGVDSEPGEESALVVFADGDRRIALMVDRVIGMAPYPEGEEDVAGGTRGEDRDGSPRRRGPSRVYAGVPATH